MDLLHHLTHLVLYSVLLWQLVLGIWIILIWASKNLKFHRSPNVVFGETIKKESSIQQGVKKDLGPIEVDVKSNMIMDTKSDESSVKLDEKIKGKVKTQKDKLRNLRK